MEILKLLIFTCHVACLNARIPIIIIPGIGGSQIDAKLDLKSVKHDYCDKKSDWFTIWVNPREMLPLARNCWVDNLKMEYNESSGKMQDKFGVNFRVPGFGNTTTIEWLDPATELLGAYFSPFVRYFVKKYGYERGIDLRAAPYDFRKDPSLASEYMMSLKNLIEETYANNGNKAVLLISHSMGAPYTLHFLHTVSSEWKSKYIKAWTTLSGAFAGAIKPVMAYISGDSFGIPRVLDKPSVLREFQRTLPGLAFLLPDSRFWNRTNDTLVTTPSRTYNVDQMEELLNDTGYTTAVKIFKAVPKAWNPVPPNVKMFCFHGHDVKTPSKLKYTKKNFTEEDPDIEYGDGDGTVNLRSLEACKRWFGKQKQKITYKTFEKAEHTAILRNINLLTSMDDVLEELNSSGLQLKAFSFVVSILFSFCVYTFTKMM